MAWRGIGELAGDVMQRVKAAAAEQGNAATALAPAARRGNCGDELLREECDSPSPMRVSGGNSAQSEFKTDRDALEGVASPRPGQPAFLLTNRVDANRCLPAAAFRRPIGRSERPARAAGRHMLVVWDADRHAAASLQR